MYNHFIQVSDFLLVTSLTHMKQSNVTSNFIHQIIVVGLHPSYKHKDIHIAEVQTFNNINLTLQTGMEKTTDKRYMIH